MVHPIGRAAQHIGQLNTEGVAKGTKVRSLNRQSASKWLLGIPLMFSRKLTVWDAQRNTHVYTSVSKSDWSKVKQLARRNDGDVGSLSSKSLALRKKLALEIIRKSGDAAGLSVLDRASPQQLCVIARSLARYGHDAQYRDQVFNALRQAQNQWQAMSMDPQTLEMTQKFVSDGRLMDIQLPQERARVMASYHQDHVQALEKTAPKRLVTSQADFTNGFRKFVGDLFSEDERDRDQGLNGESADRQARLKGVFEKHPGVVWALMRQAGTVETQAAKLAQSCGVTTELVTELVNLARELRPSNDPLLSPQEVEAAVKRSVPADFATLANTLDKEVDQYDLQKLGTFLKDKIPQKRGNFGQFLSQVFDRYFSQLPTADRRGIISTYLRESKGSDSEETQMAAALKGSGPYMLKILQLMGDGVDASTESGQKLKKALGELKDNLVPISPDIQKAMIMDLLTHNRSTVQGLTNIRSLGAASVGETLMAEARLTNGQTKEVVLKLLKPGVDQRAARERAVMEAIAQEIPGMEETFAGIADQIDRELDLSREAANVEQAAVYRSANLGYLQPVKTLANLGANQDFMFMEKASGGTVKHAMNEMAAGGDKPVQEGNLQQVIELQDRLKEGEMLSQRLESLSRVWLKQALFGKGFFHGDLHSGNMMFGNTQGQEGLLTLIDFGNAGTLTRAERAGMLKLMLAAENRYPQQFVDTLATMVGPKSQALLGDADKKEQLVAQVSELFADPTMSGSQRMMEAFNIANQFDVAVPNPITNFSRSRNMLDRTIKDLNAINLTNWQILEAAGKAQTTEPVPLSLTDIFKATVKSQKRQILALTGRDAWNMRKENPDLPKRPLQEMPGNPLNPLPDQQPSPSAQAKQEPALIEPKLPNPQPQLANQSNLIEQAKGSDPYDAEDREFMYSFTSKDEGYLEQESDFRDPFQQFLYNHILRSDD